MEFHFSNCLACRYANNDSEFKESALKLMVNLTNIK